MSASSNQLFISSILWANLKTITLLEFFERFCPCNIFTARFMVKSLLKRSIMNNNGDVFFNESYFVRLEILHLNLSKLELGACNIKSL